MKKYIVSFIILLFVSTTVLALPLAKVNLKVVDESGVPIAGAKAGLRFMVGKKLSKTRVSSDSGITDSDGLFTGSGESPRYVHYGASKDGYYGTGGEIRMKGVTGLLGAKRWEPWNPTVEIVLKKKENPIPLYAYRMDDLRKKMPELPVLDRFVGYDLIARDWVVPHGLGTHRDILFKLEKHHVTKNDGYHITFTIAFENEGDGIQSYFSPVRNGSNFKLPHHAPTAGYNPMIVVDKERTKTEILSGKSREDQNYFFRVRTKRDDKGNVTSALYGKIYGDIKSIGFAVLPTSKIRFNYYLNPTANDTNLEFDPEKNLFKGLSVNEQVSRP